MPQIHAQNKIRFGERLESWESLETATIERLGPASARVGRRTVFVVSGMEEALGAIAYGLQGGLDFGVIENSRLSPEVEARFADAGVELTNARSGALIGLPAKVAEFVPGRITVLTSGTTGLLKLIPHTPDTLNTFDRVREMPPNGWFLPYQIGSYAWFQMVALGLFVAEQTLIPGDFSDLAGSFETALRTGAVSAISSTPTFWRHALMSIDEDLLRAADLKSISMGGEIVDQPILDRLASLYPNAKIRHIYASSEAGAAIVVTDGRAGFDAGLLSRASGAIGVKVEDGRLYIRSPYVNRDETEVWVDTGDLVEERAGRVYFCGRAGNQMINVGGQKAFPVDIETHLMTHPDVVWAQVTARRAPLVGHLPVAQVVLSKPMNADDAEAMMIAHCDGRLAEYAVPRMWDFLETVPMRASLKS
ncbi:AMP-binding enzyme [Thioclava sp. FR2]|uniref:AMP-binding enzyme n=1 Tax=Thioclava sp. FR2 TaxID=3445780 RepID=UPI003EB9EA8C